MRRWIGWLAALVTVALFVTLAVIAGGFDARETPREEAAVWVARSAGQYARVNTLTAEIDTVRQVENPSGVVQAGSMGLLLTQGHARAWHIDQANPADVGEVEPGDSAPAAGAAPSAVEAIRTPDGTSEVLASRDAVLYRTEAGQALLAAVDPTAELGLGQARALEPRGADASTRIDAIALEGDTGLIALFAAEQNAVYWYDIGTRAFRRGASEVPAAVPESGTQLAIVAGEWVLFDAASGRVWRERASEPTVIETTGTALLQASSGDAAGSDALIADEAGLWAIDAAGGAERLIEAAGTPARPVATGGELAAGWIGAAAGQLWTASGGATALELDPAVDLPGELAPVIHSNGSHAVLAETRTGMLWRVPDGRLIGVDQWQLITPPQQEIGARTTEDIAEPRPPVAVPDSFGVRAGEPALLPVLLNDFDPNRRDVLTIVPESLGESAGALDATFGAVELLSDGQALLVRPDPEASGSATFSYRVSDGQQLSEPATVRLTIAQADVNSAPEWCPVQGCQRSWPSPELAPGGTLVLSLLEGWVDPEGDPIVLADAAALDPAAPVRVLVTADGKLAVRHTDSASADGEVLLRVGVTDARGARRERELRIAVRSGAAIEFTALASTVRVGETAVLRPLERMSGGSGAFELLDASVQQGSTDVSVQQGVGTLQVTAPGAGSSLIGVTVRDSVTGQEIVGTIRVTAVEQRGGLAVPPLRAFVRPLADSTVEVLDAIPAAASRGLAVESARVVDGRLRTDVIEHARIRVSGSTLDGQPGRIGAADVVVTEGESSAVGRLTVFQVSPDGSGAIAVADTATVRAGSVVDIPVLDNDVAPPGERLVLHPEVAGTGAGLAFASGSAVRVLAPREPGTYTLSYTTYGASSPELGDTAQITLTVLPIGSNRSPVPSAVTVRVGPGETVTAAVPLSGVDPDGDRVRVVGVAEPEDPQLVASLQPRTGVIEVTAAPSAPRGTRETRYTVRDGAGGEAEGRLRIIVTDPAEGGGAPVAYSDYVRIAQGVSEPAVVRPLENDIDPSGGALELVAVEPNVPGGEGSPGYSELATRLDLSELQRGVVRVSGGEALGTASFRYTVRSTATGSTADGLIVVQVSARVGLQAPRITDTVLSVRDRADFAGTGVDVVEGRVRWATGDVSELQLSLWGDAADRYRVSGNRISGEYRAAGDLVPFRLSGLDASGAEVESFGFLVVPPLDELRLGLKPGATPLTVDEGQSLEVSVRSLLDLAPGDQIVVTPGQAPAQRAQASCQIVNGTTLRYTAGEGEPWVDSCTVRVRLAEQTAVTAVPVPVRIVPRVPVAVLRPLTRTIAPGAAESIALGAMVEWQGGREGQMSALQFEVSETAAAFVVTRSGGALTVQARAGATPGAQEQLTVRVTGAGTSQAFLTLRVGEAAIDAPRGGAVTLSCTVGAACASELVGAPGEYDPFAGRPGGGLRLNGIDAASCAVAGFAIEGDSVRVTWVDQRVAGGTCQIGFTVRDAQNREGAGVLNFEALGVPPAPALVEQIGFTDAGLTLRVTLGDAQAAYPALTGVVIRQDGAPSSATCTPAGGSYTCEVGGLAIGVEHRFAARAVNEVGESHSTPEVVGWAYRAPATPTATAEQTGVAPGGDSGTVRVRVSGGADVLEYRFLVDGVHLHSLTPRGASGTADAEVDVLVGDHRFQVVPVSRYPHPLNEPNTGAATAPQPLLVAGPPNIRSLTLTTEPGGSTVMATVDLSANWGEGTRYGVSTTGACAANSPGLPSEPIPLNGATGDTMVVTVCASNDWGDATPVTRQIVVGGT